MSGGFGRGRGGGGGRSGGGRGGYGSSGGGRGGGSSGPSGSGAASEPRHKLCRDYCSKGQCHRGENCNFVHTVKHHGSVRVSDRNKDFKPAYSRGYGQHGGSGNRKEKEYHKVTSVSVWEAGGAIKLFTGSHDGKWRLWNTAGGKLTKEFEHFVGGPVDAVHIASHYFFCGFEASPKEAPDAKAGMVHSWNLNAPSDPPMELMMGPFSKYAGSGRIRSLWTADDGRVWSGGSDGSIRQWAFAPTGGPGGKPGFALARTMSGHLGAVTGLALVSNLLWSGGMDGTLRLWNVDSGDETHIIPAWKKEKGGSNNNGGVQASQGPQGTGHAGPVTGLLPFDLPADPNQRFVISSSLDDTVKVWNSTNGECVASESHGQGVTSIALTADPKGNPLLLCGLFYGDIMIRGTVSNPPLVSLLKISHGFVGVGHELGPVNDIRAGPGNTFYVVADDGKMTVWQITGDFGL